MQFNANDLTLLLLFVLLSLRLRAVMILRCALGDLLAAFVGNHRAITSCWLMLVDALCVVVLFEIP